MRSDAYPTGLPNLSAPHAQQVDVENRVLGLVSDVLSYCVHAKVLVSVELPTKSKMWEVPFFSNLLDDLDLALSSVPSMHVWVRLPEVHHCCKFLLMCSHHCKLDAMLVTPMLPGLHRREHLQLIPAAFARRGLNAY